MAESSDLSRFINTNSMAQMPQGADRPASGDDDAIRRRNLTLASHHGGQLTMAHRPPHGGGGFLRPEELAAQAPAAPAHNGQYRPGANPLLGGFNPGYGGWTGSPFAPAPSGSAGDYRRLVRGSDLPNDPSSSVSSLPPSRPDSAQGSYYAGSPAPTPPLAMNQLSIPDAPANGPTAPGAVARPLKRAREGDDGADGSSGGSPSFQYPSYPQLGPPSGPPLSAPPLSAPPLSAPPASVSPRPPFVGSPFQPSASPGLPALTHEKMELLNRLIKLHPNLPREQIMRVVLNNNDTRAMVAQLERGAGQTPVQPMFAPQPGHPAPTGGSPWPQQLPYAATPGQYTYQGQSPAGYGYPGGAMPGYHQPGSAAAAPPPGWPHAQQQQQALMARMQQNQQAMRAPPQTISAQQAAMAAQQAQQRKLKRDVIHSDEEEESSEGSMGDDFGEDLELAEKEAIALKFFNECKETELPDVTACTMVASRLVISLRPFESVEELRTKLRKTKGVSATLFDNFVDIIRAYDQVDRVFEQCSTVGSKLSQVMRIWTGAPVQPRLPGSPSKAVAGTSRAATPDSASRAASPELETGVHLVELDETALAQSKTDDAPEDVKAAFADYIAEQPAAIPDQISLKGYQLLGVNWLNLLYREGHSCILADEMGLGKTIQVIAFLAHLKAVGHKGPHLVVVPSSTLDNWLREFSVFAPSLNVQSYYGTLAERAEIRNEVKASKDLDVLVTTYNMASGGNEDRRFLKRMSFKTGTYDEGHQLKNAQSKKYKDLMELSVPWRLLLTGTPLQNNLTELISLLSFILPRIFHAADESFRAIFKVPAQGHAHQLSQKRIDSAKRIMTPFVLRRKKLQVLTDLPAKHERIEFCDMTDAQQALYREAMIRSKRVLMAMPDDPDALLEMADDILDDVAPKKRGPKKGTIKTSESSSSNVLMDLRKAANHPMLFRRLYDSKQIQLMAKDCIKEPDFAESNPNLVVEDMEVMTDFELHRFVKAYKYLQKYALSDQNWMQAGKVEALQRILPPALERGDRVLIFSQFTQVLDILEAVLETMGVRYLKLTGQTNVSDRQAIVDQFYADKDIGVFLLSTRAGGLGLNLAAANIVIMWDMDFNPHNDKQAEDRAWRIGQTRDVHVIRFITRGTIEEDMLALAQTKLALDKQISFADDDVGRALASAPSVPSHVAAAASGGDSKAGSGASTPAVVDADDAVRTRKMKGQLLHRIRQKLEHDEQTQVEAAQASASSSSPGDTRPASPI